MEEGQPLTDSPTPGLYADNAPLPDISSSVTILVDENNLPQAPDYEIRSINDLMLVIEKEPGNLMVIDSERHVLLKRIRNAGYRSHVITFHPIERRWAYLISRDGWLFKIDLYSLQLVRKVKIGDESISIAISDDGRYLMAGNYVPNTAVVLDANTLEPLKVFRAQGISEDGRLEPSRISAILDSPHGYFVAALKEAGAVVVVDWKRKDFPVVVAFDNLGKILHDAFMTPDARFFIVGSQVAKHVAVIDLNDLELVKTIPVGDTYHPGSGVIVKRNGKLLGISSSGGDGKVTVWDTANWEVVMNIDTLGPGEFVADHPRSEYIWVDLVHSENNEYLQLIEKDSMEVVKNIKAGPRALHPEFTPDGRYVYVSLWGGDKVVVYDAQTLERVKEFDATTPTGIFSAARAEIHGK